MRVQFLVFVSALITGVLARTQPVAQYRSLPTLREQNELEKGWVQKRYDFIPTLLKK